MGTIKITNSKVVINNQNNVGDKKKKHFKRMLRIGKLRFYITWNFRLKNTQIRDNEKKLFDIVPIKEKLWEREQGCCMMCGKQIGKFCNSQIHHVLPYARFPEFATNKENLLLLCRDCHKEIHTNPFLDCNLQQNTARKLGVKLKDYYTQNGEL